MNSPLVSVIVPNYCHAKYLEQRIDSILNQTYENYEIIILDDCSPDNGSSKGVIEKYRTNPHISHIIYNEENSGSTFKQWYKGFELAKGELIWIAESDDFCKETLLEELVKEFIDSQCVLAFVDSQHVDSNSVPLETRIETETIERMNGIDFIKKYMTLGNTIENASSAVFRRDTALSVDRQFTHYKGAGDQLFWIEMAENGTVVYNHCMLNMFRQHGENTTQRLYADGTTFRELYIIYKYLCDKKIIKGLRQKMKAKTKFIDWINWAVEDINIKKGLLRLWNRYNIVSIYNMTIVLCGGINNKIKRFLHYS